MTGTRHGEHAGAAIFLTLDGARGSARANSRWIGDAR